MSERKRGIVCAYCGMAWGYEGETPTPELIKEACDHEAVCEKNPYTAQIRNLKRERDEAREMQAKALRERESTEREVDAMLERAIKAEQERDEAREQGEIHYANYLAAREHWGTESMNAAQFFSEKTKAIAERDEAREDAQRKRVELNHLWQANEMAEQAFRERNLAVNFLKDIRQSQGRVILRQLDELLEKLEAI